MRQQRSQSLRTFVALAATLVVAGGLCASPATAQAFGTIEGQVTQADGGPLSSVLVSVAGTGIATSSGIDGRYTLLRVPAGPQTVLFQRLGYAPAESPVTVTANARTTVDVTLESAPMMLGEIIVEGASRAPERVVEAPAAVSVIPRDEIRDISITGQTPLALANVPGVDIVQSGINDFNVNARGFNSSLNRRILVLQDGRDLAIAFLGSQEWPALALPPGDLARLEMVRGPGSALYGANAFAGVLNLTTPLARDVQGTKITLAGGELSTIRADLRHAGVAAEGRFGYRFNVGYYRSESFTRSRTLFDGTSLQQEYDDTSLDPTVEAVPLSGQTVDATTGAPLGDADEIQNIYGSARFDYYLPGGSIFTADGGAARVENEVFVTGIGRVQVTRALRPWARVAFASENFNLMAWYSGRNSLDAQISLPSSLPLEERSTILHVEGQYNRSFADDRARIILGASARNYMVDTEGTLMAAVNDDRSDQYFAGYGQIEFRPIPEVRIVGAARVDDGDLFETQFSPKGAIVVSPTRNHSVRFTVNRAFQTPNYSEFFLQAPAAAPTSSPFDLEAGLEGYFTAVQASLPAAVLAGLNLDSLPWNFSALTQALALGNGALDVEKVTGFELGYKGTIADRAFVTVDLYWSRLSNFVTDLLPGVNPAFPSYLLTDGGRDVPATLADLDARLASLGLPADHPLRAPIPLLTGGFSQLAPLLATFEGSPAIVVSYANAGKVTERGVEIGASVAVTDEVRVAGTYAFFNFDVDAAATAGGDILLPNTAKHRATGAISYRGRQGLDLRVSARIVDEFQWAAGVFAGTVPASQTVTASAGYAVSPNLRIHVIATNVFDQQRFHLFGGSVIGRRVMGGVTAAF